MRQAQGLRQLVQAARPLRQPAQVTAQARAVGRQAVFEQGDRGLAGLAGC